MPPHSCLSIRASQQIPIAPLQLAAFRNVAMGKKRKRARISSEAEDSVKTTTTKTAPPLDRILCQILEDDPSGNTKGLTKKQLKRRFKAIQDDGFSKKDFKEALNNVVRCGYVVCLKHGNKKYYRHSMQSSDDEILQMSLYKSRIVGTLQNLDKGLSKEELEKAVVENHDEGRNIHYKTFKRCLKGLIQTGIVDCVKEGKKKRYRLVENVQERNRPESEGEENQSKRDTDFSAVPIAMRLRGESIDDLNETKKVTFQEVGGGGDDVEDIDAEIARLERELAKDDDSDSDEESGEDADEDGSHDEEQPAVLSLSKFSDDRVQHLPAAALPEPGKYDSSGMPIKKKKKRKVDNDGSAASSGLEQAVKEVLSGYQARSSERLPFYCRFCAKQYDNETEFFAHKSQDFHKAALEAERKATYCKLCRVQLTSPVQMQEHLKSRPHKERLQTMKSKHQGGRMSNGSRNHHYHAKDAHR
jgi:hypothetical protein